MVASFTPQKAYQCAAMTAPGIQSGGTYTLVVGATVSGADENGYAANAKKSGGTTLVTVDITSELYGSGGMDGPGGMGGSRPGK